MIKNNGEILDDLLVVLESCIFTKSYGGSITTEEIETAIAIANKLIKFDEEFTLIQEEIKILWARVEQLEIENRYLLEEKNNFKKKFIKMVRNKPEDGEDESGSRIEK